MTTPSPRKTALRRALAAGMVLSLIAGVALAAPVTLRANASTPDGRITLGELFRGAGPAANILIANGRPGANVVLDAAQVQAVAQANGLDWANPAGLRRIVVRAGAAQAQGSGTGQTLTYVHSLTAGAIVAPEDVAWTPLADGTALPGDAPKDAGAVIGMAAKRPLRAGAAVAMHDVGAPRVIKKDDIVSVAYEAEGISLTLQAKALDSAGVGELLNVLNPASKKIVQAMATGPGQAVVGPSADRLKTALMTQPNLLASLR